MSTDPTLGVAEHARLAQRLLTWDGFVDGWPDYEIAKLNALQAIGHALLALQPPATPAQASPEPETTTWLTVTEIAGLLGVSRPRVWQLRKHPDFPEPAGRHGHTDYWAEHAIRAWATAVGRSLDEDDPPAGDDNPREQLNHQTQTRRTQ